MPRWAVWVLIAVAAGLIAGPRLWPASTATKVTYTEFLDLVQSGKVSSVEINNLSNTISGKMSDGSEFITTGAASLSDADEQLLKEKGVDYDYSTPQGNFFTNLILEHGIQVTERFVHQENSWIWGDSSCQSHPLLLST